MTFVFIFFTILLKMKTQKTANFEIKNEDSKNLQILKLKKIN